MRILLFLCLLLFASHLSHAHKVNEAFFVVKKQGNHIVVESEFPWTLRNVLIAFNPKLENAKDKKEFENTFVQYIEANLILIDPDGIPLPFEGFKEMDKSGHSHQNDFILSFRGASVAEITNTMMFNIYNNQINYIRVELDDGESRYKTKREKSTIKIKEKKYNLRIGYIVMTILFIVMGFVLIKKITANNVSPK